MSKHTPGPWQFKPWNGRLLIQSCNERATWVAEIMPGGKADDARIIACAPQMFELLGYVIHSLAETGECRIKANTEFDKVLQALYAKATGGDR